MLRGGDTQVHRNAQSDSVSEAAKISTMKPIVPHSIIALIEVLNG